MRRTRHLAMRFMRFGAVGASGTAVNLIFFWLFTTVWHLHYMVGGPLAFELSFLSNYILHNTWTFGDMRPRFLSASLLRCQVVSGGGLLINLAILHLCVSALGMPALLGNLVGIGLATAWNFCLSVGWTWRSNAVPGALTPAGALTSA